MSNHNYKDEINDLISRALSDGVSDIHLAAGHYPTFRVSGNLLPVMNIPVQTPEGTLGMLRELITPDFMERFLKDKEIDFSYDFLGKRVSVAMHSIKKERLASLSARFPHR